MITNPDPYFEEGCGRCPHFSTPRCKVKSWPLELKALRDIILSTGLEEEAKWGVPCHTHNGINILILSAFREYCTVSFFKGALLKDLHELLIKPTENSNADRAFRSTDTQRIVKLNQ